MDTNLGKCAGTVTARSAKPQNVGSIPIFPSKYTHRELITMDIDTQDFKKAFWQWFDNELSQDDRLKFKTYPADMSELYFYNKIWSKSKTHYAHVSPNATNVDKGNWSG